MIQFCERIAEGVSAYLDGEATDVTGVGLDRHSIEAHLGACPYCGALRHRLEKVQDLTRAQAPESGPPPRVWDGIEAVLRAEGIVRSD